MSIFFCKDKNQIEQILKGYPDSDDYYWWSMSKLLQHKLTRIWEPVSTNHQLLAYKYLLGTSLSYSIYSIQLQYNTILVKAGPFLLDFLRLTLVFLIGGLLTISWCNQRSDRFSFHSVVIFFIVFSSSYSFVFMGCLFHWFKSYSQECEVGNLTFLCLFQVLTNYA